MKKKQEEWAKPKTIILEVDVFNTDVVFFIDKTEKQIKKELAKLSGDKYLTFNEEELEDWDNTDTNLGRMIPFAGGFIVLLKMQDKYRDFISTVFHEIIHVSHYLLRNRRIQLNEDTEEIYCYLAESLSKNFMNKLY